MGPKESDGKQNWFVFPFEEAEEVLKAFEYGAKKYGRAFSYRDGIDPSKLWSAALRHLIAMHKKGFDSVDDESECLHAASVAANMLMIISQINLIRSENGDDRSNQND